MCAAPLKNISRLPVCDECLSSLQPMHGEFCAICSESVAGFAGRAEGEPLLCGLCQRARPPFEQAVAFGSYDGTLRELLHLFKYEGVRPAAAILGKLLAEAAQGLELKNPVVVPVPLHRDRRRERGFNQAELIARAALPQFGMGVKFEAVLRRKRATDSQTGLTRHQRRTNVQGAFEVTNREKIVNRDVLLVDDVFTTGTTAAACAKVLLRAGARRVFVATVARVQKGQISQDFKAAAATGAAN